MGHKNKDHDIECEKGMQHDENGRYCSAEKIDTYYIISYILYLCR